MNSTYQREQILLSDWFKHWISRPINRLERSFQVHLGEGEHNEEPSRKGKKTLSNFISNSAVVKQSQKKTRPESFCKHPESFFPFFSRNWTLLQFLFEGLKVKQFFCFAKLSDSYRFIVLRLTCFIRKNLAVRNVFFAFSDSLGELRWAMLFSDWSDGSGNQPIREKFLKFWRGGGWRRLQADSLPEKELEGRFATLILSHSLPFLHSHNSQFSILLPVSVSCILIILT